MKVYHARHFQYVLVHTDHGFFKIDNLGGILRWNDHAVNHWEEAASLSSAEVAELVTIGLEKFSPSSEILP